MRDDVQMEQHWSGPGVDDVDAVWARIEPELGRQRKRWLPGGTGRWLVPAGAAAALAGAVILASTWIGGGEAVAVTEIVDDLDAASRAAAVDAVVTGSERAEIMTLALGLVDRLEDGDVFDGIESSELARVVITLDDVGGLLDGLPEFPDLEEILGHIEEARGIFGGFLGQADGVTTFRAGPAGTVTIEDRDGVLTVTAIEPRPGWTGAPTETGDDRVEVTFSDGADGSIVLVAERIDGGVSVAVTSDGIPLDLHLERELPFLDPSRFDDFLGGLPRLEGLLPEPGERFPTPEELFPGFFEEFEGFLEGEPLFGDLPPFDEVFPSLDELFPRLDELPSFEAFPLDDAALQEFLSELEIRLEEGFGALPTFGILREDGRSVHAVGGAGTVTLGYDGELQVIDVDPAEGWASDIVIPEGEIVEVRFSKDGEERVFRAETSAALVKVTVDREGR
jgi:hypothetical protein